MKSWIAALQVSALAAGAVMAAVPAQAQGVSFPDVPQNHWAYQAVQDLADKGYIKGYPDGKFLGKRAMTRYEFATLVDRMVQTITDLSAKVSAGQTPTTPTGTPVTQDDLNRVQSLVDSFRAQLEAIQSSVADQKTNFQDQIDALRQDVLDAKALAGKAQDTANNSFGLGANRKLQITGYVQARLVGADGHRALFPDGNATTSGAYNGTYGQGGNMESFELRRARLKVTGSVTPNTRFGIQIDTSGAINAGGTANQQVTVREGYVAYTFGDGNPAHAPTVTAGQFATPFGYQLPASGATILTTERPLAFSEASYGLFAGEDYEKGVQIGYQTPQQLVFLPSGIRLTVALVNGTGRTSENTTRQVDQIYGVNYQTPNKVLGVGGSFYEGKVVDNTGVGPSFYAGKKELYDANAQLALPFGVFLNGEYVNGIYEQRGAFGAPNASGIQSFTNAYAQGNRVEGYYAQGGYTFFSKSPRPLTFYIGYDKLRRAAGNNGNDSYDDENLEYGAAYNLDSATRVRFQYTKPDKVAHLPNVAEPARIGYFAGELQVRF